MIRLIAAAALAIAPAIATAQTAPTYQGQDGQTKEAIGTFPTKGAPGFATNQVTAGTTPTLIVPARERRQTVILNVLAANTCAFGNSTVTLATGLALQPVAGASVTWPAASPVYAACSASTPIAFAEFF